MTSGPGVITGLVWTTNCGLKEKVLAARRAGLDAIILPRENERDLDDLVFQAVIKHHGENTFSSPPANKIKGNSRLFANNPITI